MCTQYAICSDISVWLCQEQLRKAKKKQGEENIQKAIKAATDIAEAAVAEGKPFCIARLDVGVDTTAAREAVIKVIDKLVRVSNVGFELSSYFEDDLMLFAE